MALRGRIANPSRRGQRVRGVYFFAGDARPDNQQRYTVHPDPEAGHLSWSASITNREFALDEMVDAGANTVIMSTWGEPDTDRWKHYAPMHTNAEAQDDLFALAASRKLLVMPAIESSASTRDEGGKSASYHFAHDFPGSLSDPAPQVVHQCVDLVDRYLRNLAHPEWARSWLRLYDRQGKPRYAVHLLHVSSHDLDPHDHSVFAAAFDRVAEAVYRERGVHLGFTLDILRHPQLLPEATANARDWVPWFPVQPQTTTSPAGAVTAVWANPEHLDLFMVDAAGFVATTWWYRHEPNGYRPGGWLRVGNNRTFPPGAPVTAVWATKDHLDLFAVDAHGHVSTTWWDRAAPNGYRDGGWVSVGEKHLFPPGAPVTTVWSSADHLDLFAIDTQGVVQTIWWDRRQVEGFNPLGWLPIHHGTTSSPGGHVTAVWATVDHLDLFVVDRGGHAVSIWWDRREPKGFPPQGWFPVGGEHAFVPGARIVALWAPGAERHLDLLAADREGAVVSTWWDAPSSGGFSKAGWSNEGWFEVGAGNRSVGGGYVDACWIRAKELQVTVVTLDGTVHEASWDGDWQPWHPVSGAFAMTPGQQLSLVAHDPEHTDLFLADKGGQVRSTHRSRRSDRYVATSACVGKLLAGTRSVLAVQGFIPEVGKRLDGSLMTEGERINIKQAYWNAWLASGLPVLFDVSPGYDAHLVFKDSQSYGNNQPWRGSLEALWSAAFTGIAFNCWNGYTEGYAAMPTAEYKDANWLWLKRLFAAATKP